MKEEMKATLKKTLKITGIVLGSCITAGALGYIMYKAGQNSVEPVVSNDDKNVIDKDQIIGEFIANTVRDEWNHDTEHVYEVKNCDGTVYAKWSVTDERPAWLDDDDAACHEFNKQGIWLDDPLKFDKKGDVNNEN